jgi:hypothetical protein
LARRASSLCCPSRSAIPCTCARVSRLISAAIGRRLLALQHFQLVLEGLNALVLLLDALEQSGRIRRCTGLTYRAAKRQRKDREHSKPRTWGHEFSFGVLVYAHKKGMRTVVTGGLRSQSEVGNKAVTDVTMWL